MDRRIEYMSLGSLLVAKRNPKSHDLGQLHISVGRFGYTEPVLIDERTGRLVAGHGRLGAMTQLREKKAQPPEGVKVAGSGEWLIPVVRGWASRSDEDAEAYLLASNQLTMLGGWNDSELAKTLKDLAAADALDGTGFDGDDVDRLLADMADAVNGLTDPDDVPEPASAPYVKRGDVFELGQHRITCGDCTDAVVVSRIMGGERAAVCLTDPPYGIGEAYESHDDTQQNLAVIVREFLPLARDVSDVVLLTPGVNNIWLYPKPAWTLAWFIPAGSGMSAWGFCCWQPVLAYGRDPYLAEGKGSRPDSLVKTEAADNSLGHPCSKPVETWKWFLERGSIHAGDIVFEPFSGSGTTLIACEQLGRRCRAIEVEPKYVQVAIERWEAFTGTKARKLSGNEDTTDQA